MDKWIVAINLLQNSQKNPKGVALTPSLIVGLSTNFNVMERKGIGFFVQRSWSFPPLN